LCAVRLGTAEILAESPVSDPLCPKLPSLPLYGVRSAVLSSKGLYPNVGVTLLDMNNSILLPIVA
jgi:hypothetical protein